MVALLAVAVGLGVADRAAAEPLWIERIRPDHPRLFFNADTWPSVRARALDNPKLVEAVRRQAETAAPKPYWPGLVPPAPRAGSGTQTADWGNALMGLAFLYRIDPSRDRLDRIKEMLRASLDYYHACYAAGHSVHWFSTSRVGWLAAFDWVWNDLSDDERAEMGASMSRHVDEVLHKRGIQGRNDGGYETGYYGGRNLCWFAGLVMLNEGISDQKARAFLVEGYDTFQELLRHRSELAGDDGGAASATLDYALNAYPWAEWNYLYTWQSATGEDLSPQWPYVAWLPNYVLWNWLPGNHDYGYGDAFHTTNRMPTGWLYTHLSHIMNLYGGTIPKLAAFAACVRNKVGGGYYTDEWSIYPFLMTRLDEAPAADCPTTLPPARHFEKMGQTFMRSGDGPDDTYALFACGGRVDAHRHYDATHFTIYKRGHLALDSGTRLKSDPAGHTQNYYAQTVAHNCILLDGPGVDASRPKYWSRSVISPGDGQNRLLGSRVIAFETGPHYTYVAGDATPVYRSDACDLMIRQFVFIPPYHFVVFDRATSSRAEIGKRWLLHHAREPELDGMTWRSDQDRGRIFCRTLLPEDAAITKVGGPGKEFMAGAVNYPTGSPRVPELFGQWRVEVSPEDARTEDLFLHLIQVGDRSLNSMSDAQVERGDGLVTLTFEAADGSVELCFATEGPVSGHITITQDGHVVAGRDLTERVTPQAGLAAGQ